MKILAIGATGFIGTHVVERLLRSGHSVAILHRARTDATFSDHVRHVFGHRDRLSDVVEEFRRFGPDVVLDMILFTERQAYELVNELRGMGPSTQASTRILSSPSTSSSRDRAIPAKPVK